MAGTSARERLIRAAVRAARDRSTPFYLFDREAAAQRMRQWSSLAGGFAEVFYPYKCNRHPALLDLAVREGLGAEVTAAGDVEAALERVGGGRIVFQGPAKDPRSVERVVASGGWLVADSTEDAVEILAGARRAGAAPKYLLRLRPKSVEPEQIRFGMEPRELLALARRLARERRPLPRGVAFHLGTGLAGPASHVAAIRGAGALFQELRAAGFPVEVLDVGGGFPADGEARRDRRGRVRGRPVAAKSYLGAIAREAARLTPGARVFLEPGRAFASDAFHLVTRVVLAAGRTVYVDASRLSHGFFVPRGRHAFTPFPLRHGDGRVGIAGPLAVGLDVFSEGERVGRPRKGDLVVIESVGAYNLIAANAWAGPVPEVVGL